VSHKKMEYLYVILSMNFH